MKHPLFFIASLASLVIVLGSLEAALKAVAILKPTEGNHVSGQVNFEEEEGGVRITAHLTGLKPGQHGIHVHEKGDCSSPDGSSAGGHFNPDQMPHSSPGSITRHVGDLGNITADEKGVAEYSALDQVIKLDGPQSVIGRAVIVHADPDDYMTQPTGNAGARVACGVITLQD
jgi:Cu-Zn family superoxide dismutase